MRRSLVIAIVLGGIAIVLLGGPALLFSPATNDAAPANKANPEIVDVEDSDSGFWPYLSPQKAHQKRSPVNLLVRGNSEDIVRALSEQSDGDWAETDLDHFDEDGWANPVGSAANESPSENGSATENGSTPENGSGAGNESAGGPGSGGEAGTGNGSGAGNASGVGNESGVDNDTDRQAENETFRQRANETLRQFATEIPWAQATGATRYAYIDPGEGEDGYWTTETLQIEDGDYYGQRYHIRLYESPNPADEWVAMQAHTEHFDWFTLRHRVDGSEAAQSRAEADLMSVPTVDDRQDVTRINLDNGGPSDSNGWATRVDLRAAAVVPIVVGVVARGRRREIRQGLSSYADRYLTESDRERLAFVADRVEARHLVLGVAIAGLLLGVRLAGIVLEHNVDFLSMHGIAAILYPVIAVGIPVATYLIASGLERRLDAAIVASTSLAIAIWIDYGMLGVERLPVDVVLQRMLVIVALGLIAAGAARRATRDRRLNDMLVAGTVTWVLVLVGTLVGVF